ncbi:MULTISPECIES: site-specific integrase [unclassified Mesorhizobium]|uniref:site-specific integrase n=1 Tax=unclassified Mesorhizobium TaxID=325217 RepID=UPI000FCC2247|nr:MULTISPECIES: site-specific integrase [unclassified Mesorhizobium]TGP24894.1 site-specific integrase [Mesorhizobium sp. M1D.F.Ca.ET.231.01.1.1]TGP36217.1 site-specific integrase [Mesorhizobium sp. M1D.F.Ca.ET.234.01.1.1]TGS49719.1 site-specific integrase [Mesorhizobium sp. M1D.F.Ca.ET.184.01.1.1]TGS64431.1 site-specific integrase [Mesorhizobium sp. M1D.F.Ca.ET.183.01.1.1]
MSIRKRKWKTNKGLEKEAWVVDYLDCKGIRRLKTFAKKKDADQFEATAKVEVREGVHVADSDSATVKAAGDFWIATAVAAGLERGTIVQYRQHLDLHIVPAIGETLLSKLTVPVVRSFEDQLRANGVSSSMVRKVLTSLGSLLADAQERGLVIRNAVREKSRARQKGKDRRQERRHRGKLKVEVDIPAREEIKAIVGTLTGRWRPVLLTAIFTGLRASELRGLRWSDVDLDRREIHVRQRADRFNEIGRPKSEAGERTVPMPPLVANTLREWRLACPRPRTGEEDADGAWLVEEMRPEQLVFPNGQGKVESLSNIMQRGFLPAQVEAGVAIDTGEKDSEGLPVMRAKYTGLHALRHFYASWLINRLEDGGLALPAKMVQERLGHSSITLTMDTYGHLFPRADDASELAAAESAFFQ